MDFLKSKNLYLLIEIFERNLNFSNINKYLQHFILQYFFRDFLKISLENFMLIHGV